MCVNVGLVGIVMLHTFNLPLEEGEDPFLWWSKHEGQFLIVAYLARAILGILGSQIEIERIFSIVDILIGLHCGQLGPYNLDLLVPLIKN
jgi:hypothetical protein